MLFSEYTDLFQTFCNIAFDRFFRHSHIFCNFGVFHAFASGHFEDLSALWRKGRHRFPDHDADVILRNIPQIHFRARFHCETDICRRGAFPQSVETHIVNRSAEVGFNGRMYVDGIPVRPQMKHQIQYYFLCIKTVHVKGSITEQHVITGLIKFLEGLCAA